MWLEYEALVNGLCIAIDLGIRWLDVRGDSQLVIDQVMKESSCHNAKMDAYCHKVRQLEDKFDGLELNHISRRLNEATNTLAKMASSREPVPINIFASDLHKPFVRYEEPEQTGNEPLVVGLGADRPSVPSDLEVMELIENLVVEPDPPTDWRTPYLDCLLHEVLPTDNTEARWLARRTKSFVVIEGELYKHSLTEILQCCIPIEQGKDLLEDIHGGVCRHHAAPRTLVRNEF